MKENVVADVCQPTGERSTTERELKPAAKPTEDDDIGGKDCESEE
jgi:hypothetical protein